MTANITIRPYQASDEAGLLACWRESMWADPINTATWRGTYLLDPNYRHGSCLVAVIDNEVCGFMLEMHSPDEQSGKVIAFGVRPEHRRRGIGTTLFEQLRTRLTSEGIENVIIGPYVPSYLTPGVDEAAYPEAIAFLSAQGGEVSSRPLSMRANLTNLVSDIDTEQRRNQLAREGIACRPVEPADIVPLLTFLDREFSHWRGDASQVLRGLLQGDRAGLTMHVAFDGETIIGFAQSRLERFGPFGVDPQYRGRGVGAVLLDDTMHAMRAQGFHCAWFLWTSDRAAKLYREHGFEEVRRFSLMTLPIQVPQPQG